MPRIVIFLHRYCLVHQSVVSGGAMQNTLVIITETKMRYDFMLVSKETHLISDIKGGT
jgi:hypothetical protein